MNHQEQTCDHRNVDVIGGVDPAPAFGKRRGAWERIKFDARCADCGEHLWVEYDLSQVREP